MVMVVMVVVMMMMMIIDTDDDDDDLGIFTKTQVQRKMDTNNIQL